MFAAEPSKPPLNRQGLYALIWEKPVIHVAKRFGISDVALRKICKKHDVPLPPLGYWAKLAHGKKVTQPPLPPCKDGILDRVWLVEKPVVEEPTVVTEARAVAHEREAAAEAKIRAGAAPGETSFHSGGSGAHIKESETRQRRLHCIFGARSRDNPDRTADD